MSNEADRMSRAGNYVLGLMNEAERERAERDLQFDPSFRAAVLSVAERMRLVGAPRAGVERWNSVSAGLAELPHMRGRLPATQTPVQPAAAGTPWLRNLAGRIRPAMPSRGALAVALGLIAAFALGCVVGQVMAIKGIGPSAHQSVQAPD